MPNKYLRKKGTSEVFIWTPLLAKRNDMEDVIQITDKLASDIEIDEVKKEGMKSSEEEIEQGKSSLPPEDNNERITQIIEEIKKCEYRKRPNIFNFADRTGMKITSEERDTAWRGYLEKRLSEVE